MAGPTYFATKIIVALILIGSILTFDHLSDAPALGPPRIKRKIEQTVIPKEQPPPQSFKRYRYPFPPLQQSRSEDILDAFRDYKYRQECDISSLDLHFPVDSLCNSTEQMLTSMSNGGRPGFDRPYIPESCDMRWYSTEEVCQILSRFERVAILGDSMMRHLYAAMNIILRKNLGYGAVASWAFTDEERLNCFCNSQVNVKGCSLTTVSSTEDLQQNAPEEWYCKDALNVFQGVLLSHPIPVEHLNALAKDLRPLGTGKPTAFVYGNGLWSSLKIDKTLAWLEQINHVVHTKAAHIKEKPWPQLFISPPAAGILKDDSYIVSQGNKALMKFEHAMKELLPKRGIDVLGTWNATIQASSYDGSHQDIRSNLLKAMMMINWLDQVSKDY